MEMWRWKQGYQVKRKKSRKEDQIEELFVPHLNYTIELINYLKVEGPKVSPS